MGERDCARSSDLEVVNANLESRNDVGPREMWRVPESFFAKSDGRAAWTDPRVETARSKAERLVGSFGELYYYFKNVEE